MGTDSPKRTAAEAAALIHRFCPDVAAAHLEELPHFGWGGDSDAFLVDGTHVFRFARHEPMRRGYDVELCLLPKLAAHLAAQGVAVAIPQFTHAGRPPGEPPLFVGYPLVEGQQLTPAGLARLEQDGTGDGSDSDTLARQLAAFLAAIRTFPVQEAEACGVAGLRIPLREQIARQHGRIRERVYPVLPASARRFLDDVFDDFLGDPRYTAWPRVLCHGDLSFDHILVRSDGPAAVAARGAAAGTTDGAGRMRLAGVIDFGDVCLGDLTGDFAWRGEYGEAFFWRVLDYYRGPVAEPDKPAFAEAVNFRLALLPVAEVGYGLDVGNRDYVEEGTARLLDVMRRRA
jgi:aminoglycoside 2''-phosphotransferase